MKTIKVELKLDTSCLEQLDKLRELLDLIGGASTIAPIKAKDKATKKEQAEFIKEAKKEKVKFTDAKAELKAKGKAAKEVNAKDKKVKDKKVKDKAAKDKTESGDYSLIELRKMIKVRVDDNRAEIKAKLNSLGAPNVTKMKAEHFQKFGDFLKTIPLSVVEDE